ncbi:unnamed protein product [Adineta steineri]|uniref:G-protein coupled receptors family 1 profile domain-containing protein n=1 Tax=Adineta steineri TaxID=433720 RepID=A0A815ME33_9BILA|nr:unnamed protein product [Adineta steineri]
MNFGTPLIRAIIFGSLLTMMIPSIICSLFILFYFIRFREVLKRLNNHIILALLLINFIQVISEMPLTLIMLRTGFVAIQSPTFCLFCTIATMFLIIRILIQKRRIGQREIWRRNRKMVIQLISISIIYMVVWIPNVVCHVIPLIVSSRLPCETATDILHYVQYMPALLCPFLSLIGLPEIRKSLKQTFTRLNHVQPLT